MLKTKFLNLLKSFIRQETMLMLLFAPNVKGE